MSASNLFHILLLIIAGASLALLAFTWLEGALLIWLPREEHLAFWKTYDRLLLTLRYVSASEEKLSRARFALSTLTEKDISK